MTAPAPPSRRSLLVRLFGLRHPVVHVVRLNGTIGAGSPLRPALTLAALNDTLEAALARKGLAAVALVINSPGGSAVQSALIHHRIRQLAVHHRVPVIAFCEDVAASGGYMLAVAADEIYADVSTIVGSIGVISAGFGFVEAMRKLGIERRVYTAGRSKSVLDPFKPERKDDVERLKELQSDVHETFKALVEDRRLGRLKPGDTDLYTGEFWSGRRAVELGLIDGLGHMHQVLRDRFGDKVAIRLVAKGTGFNLRRLVAPRPAAGLEAAAAALPEAALDAAEVRALWQRFGL